MVVLIDCDPGRADRLEAMLRRQCATRLVGSVTLRPCALFPRARVCVIVQAQRFDTAETIRSLFLPVARFVDDTAAVQVFASEPAPF